MVCPSSVLAHLTKLLVTIGCMRALGDPYRVKGRAWPLRGFQVLLLHSVLGILRFGVPFNASVGTLGKYIRTFYDWYSRIIDVVSLASFTIGILHGYGVSEKIRLVIFSLGILPIVFELNAKPKESQIRKHRLLANVGVTIQLFMVTLVGLRHNNFNVLSLVVSYIFERLCIDEFCYRYDIPNTDLTQYSLCFFEIFTVLTLNEM